MIDPSSEEEAEPLDTLGTANGKPEAYRQVLRQSRLHHALPSHPKGLARVTAPAAFEIQIAAEAASPVVASCASVIS